MRNPISQVRYSLDNDAAVCGKNEGQAFRFRKVLEIDRIGQQREQVNLFMRMNLILDFYSRQVGRQVGTRCFYDEKSRIVGQVCTYLSTLRYSRPTSVRPVLWEAEAPTLTYVETVRCTQNRTTWHRTFLGPHMRKCLELCGQVVACSGRCVAVPACNRTSLKGK